MAYKLATFKDENGNLFVEHECQSSESKIVLARAIHANKVHLAMTGEPRGFSRVTAGFSSYDGEFRLPLVLAHASPIFHSD